MLHLQRASAGSGKTYSLARRFIRFLISGEKPGQAPCLGSPEQIRDNLTHILAITFTNKATAEMKDRIISKLSALAEMAGKATATPDDFKDIDYLEYFCKLFKATPGEVGEAAHLALEVLLNKFSEFRVSTIDSFFQEILRTFTYEADLSDSFQVEIDSDFVISTAIDSMLNDIDTKSASSAQTSYWLRYLMDTKSNDSPSWNIFNKSGSKESLYTEITKATNKLESENFKAVRNLISAYFKGNNADRRYIKAFEDFKEDAEKEKESAYNDSLSKADKLLNVIAGADLGNKVVKKVFDHINKLREYKWNENPNSTDLNSFNLFKPVDSNFTIFKKTNKIPAEFDQVNLAAKEFYMSLRNWYEPAAQPLWSMWKIFSPLLPYLGLAEALKNRMSDFLEARNLVKLNDTNTMLRKIIGESDTPFVYERLGTRLHHYLIDEFQDTSRLQWEILDPLVNESDGRNFDNLIIGDAKQSIYRFRNAEPSLITSVVPASYKHKISGEKREENKNYRSASGIVRFNNFFFTILASQLTETSKKNGGGYDFNSLYSNVIQLPKKPEDGEGYVEIRLLESSGDDYPGAEEIPALICSLLGRHYRPKEIAVLVSTHDEGKSVVEALVRHNSSAEPANRIDFLSEESLSISSSEAVGIIIGIIDIMARGGSVKDSSGTSVTKKKTNNYIKWSEIKDRYVFHAVRHPGLTIKERLEIVMGESSINDEVAAMLGNMQTTALPAVVEAAVERFVPESLKKSDAIYLAAFQDAVLDYCERMPADPSSFLEWWETKGKDLSITSPEDTDAVQIMTIHKSKGLEFKCVIVPFATGKFIPSPQKEEWQWVATPDILKKYDLPDVLPVVLNSSLKGTPFESCYQTYYDQVMMDKLNSTYVAFTRAEQELYIFTKENSAAYTLSTFLKNIMKDTEKLIEEGEYSEEDRTLLPKPEEIIEDEEKKIIAYGVKKEDARNTQEKGKEKSENPDKEKEKVDESFIEKYDARSILPLLHFKEEDAVNIQEEEDNSEETDPDPRSEGNLLHAVMERVNVASDLDKAFRQLQVRGLISRHQIETWKPMLQEAMEQPMTKEWFSPKWKVINERRVWEKGHKTRRPDRVMINHDATMAIVVDYKFGELTKENEKKYIEQVNRYCRLISEAFSLTDVKGYVWFPKTGLVILINS